MPRPAFDRVSALTALILLTYGLVRMMTLPTVEAEFAFLGLLIHVEFKPQLVMLILVACLAAAGSDWLIKDAIKSPSPGIAYEHWVIPVFAAVAIGAIVMRIPGGLQLWIGLVLGALLLVAILTAEFIVTFKDDPRFETVAVALRGFSFLLLTASFFAIYSTELRAVFAIPLIFAISSVTSWRLLRLSFVDSPIWNWAILLGLVNAQFAVGLHYLPLTPSVTSILLGVLAYVGFGLISLHVEQGITRKHIFEMAIVVLITLILLVLVD